MSNNVITVSSPWSAFSGPNLGYVMEQYDLFLQAPEEVEAELVTLFQQFGAPALATGEVSEAVNVEPGNFKKVLAAVQLADTIRNQGHLAADIYPLKDRKLNTSHLELSAYSLTEADLVAMPATLFFNEVPVSVNNGRDAINYLKSIIY